MGAGFTVNMIQRGAVSMGRINEILNTDPSIKNEQSIINNELSMSSPIKNSQFDSRIFETQSGVPAIELSNLEFAYNEEMVLKNINLKVNRGQWLGVMGRTGSGKSTLIKTFTRMIDPPEGTVSVLGLDVRKWRLEVLRGLFAVSPQDSYLFSDTITNNIMYGIDTEQNKELSSFNPENLEHLDKVISITSLNKDLENFQYGKETLVGERGLTLSGGQKQRTAAARAVIMDSEFLILDDSFSAVDNETEQRILESLRNERKGRTTILISHRVSTLKYADKILVLDKGKILEYGSPSELIGTGGFYSKMAAFQRMESSAPDLGEING
jgi:ATP-binding cassette subfamily B protein